MADPSPRDLWLFSYGTLRQPGVQMANFGRLLDGEADVLGGFALSTVTIHDAAVIAASGLAQHPILRASSDPAEAVEGMVFAITQAELLQADAYEVADYQRIEVSLNSGRRAFVYVAKAV